MLSGKRRGLQTIIAARRKAALCRCARAL